MVPRIKCGPWRRVGRRVGHNSQPARRRGCPARAGPAGRPERHRGRAGGRKVEATAITRGERSIASFFSTAPTAPRIVQRLARGGRGRSVCSPSLAFLCIPARAACLFTDPGPTLAARHPCRPPRDSLVRLGRRPAFPSHAPSMQPGLGLPLVPCPLSAGRSCLPRRHVRPAPGSALPPAAPSPPVTVPLARHGLRPSDRVNLTAPVLRSAVSWCPPARGRFPTPRGAGLRGPSESAAASVGPGLRPKRRGARWCRPVARSASRGVRRGRPATRRQSRQPSGYPVPAHGPRTATCTRRYRAYEIEERRGLGSESDMRHGLGSL